MSCDLSDPNISQAYKEFLQGSINWMLLGYNDTRDVISLYGKGTGGVSEFATQIKNEVLFGLVRFERVCILIQHISEQAGGVRRARGLVHGRTVANVLKDHDMQLIIGKTSELSETNLRSKIKSSNLDEIHDEGDAMIEDTLPTPAVTPNHSSASPPLSRDSPSGQPAVATHAPLLPQYQAGRLDSGMLGSPLLDSPVATLPSASTEAESRKPQGLAVQESPLEPIPSETRMANGSGSLAPSANNSPRPGTSHLPANNNRNYFGQQNVPKEELQASISDKFLQEELAKRLTLKERIDNDHRGPQNDHCGFIAVQGGRSCYWKRRWFVIRGATLYLYTSETSFSPTDALELRELVDVPRDAEADVLIPNSFFLDFQAQGPFFFYADSSADKARFFQQVAQVANI
ncbi:hypothetical protein BJ085DRAFT_30924 [Dimargaris cristalligena]|uniref:PH domain-containing protein n=1 Tax=Dimargaris cristalligena TaxID=215637 RepID=A0A4P9ZVE6_9FUNG|nr:hypothetical protein BJ085DRAFT_30924 [Dimargaris cristalligena]|eukprot:RKP37596.1 hypothetical protein BJ085DRAFT_30924 [Dimargaris cristalligena]